MPVINLVYCQLWEESERGWGVRPDGYSLHSSLDEVKKAIKKHCDNLPAHVPDEYSRPNGQPYSCAVDDEIYAKVQKEKSIYYYQNNYPKRIS